MINNTTRATVFFWIREAGLFLSVSGFAWRMYGEVLIAIFAGLAVGSILARLEAIAKEARASGIAIGSGGQLTILGGGGGGGSGPAFGLGARPL